MVDGKLLQNLSQNLLEILDDNEYYDITIEVGNDPYVNIFRAHKVILYYRSPYLRRILSTSNEKKNDGTLTHIKLPNILPEIFQIILRYIYSGTLSLNEYETSDIIKILVAANELSLKELIIHLQLFLIENRTELNFNDIYQTIFENNSFSELQKYCSDLISKDPDKIFKSLDFSSIPEKLLIKLIQNDNLQMSGIQVWEHVVKWGHAQNPELPRDPTNFSKEDFNTLKHSLQQCTPFVNFYNLTSEEFSDKVLPYKKILPKELYKDLLKHYLKPNNQTIKKSEPNVVEDVKDAKIDSKNIDSKVITSQHAELILKWINKDSLNSLNSSDSTDAFTSIFSKFIHKVIKDKDNTSTVNYTFKLLLRGTRDGFTFEKFHEICDEQFHTVTIIKVKGSNEILGGYNPVAWESDKYIDTTTDSFIFSFYNKTHILSRVKRNHSSTFNSCSEGAKFGLGDLTLLDGRGSCYQWSYEKPIREIKNKFLVEEYEVFQIMRD